MRSVSALGLFLLCIAVPARAETKLNQVTMTVGFSPGGGTDTYARLIARYLPDYLDGDVRIITQNMPGGGSLKAVQSLSAPVTPGNVNVVTFNYGLITESQVSPDRVRVKLSDYQWIGSLASVPAVCFAWHATGLRNLDDVKKRPQFNIGAPAPGSSNYINAMLMKLVLHLPVHVVTGYPGSADERLAIERGELDGGCGAWSSLPPDWIEQKKIVPLVNFSVTPVEGLPPHIPSALDLVTSEKDRQLLKLLTEPSALGRPFIASRDTPAAVVAELRTAFEKASQDQRFRDDSARLSLPLDYIDGERAEAMVKEIYATPADVVAGAKQYVE